MLVPVPVSVGGGTIYELAGTETGAPGVAGEIEF